MEDRLQSKECAERLKALANQDRLKIIQCLQSGPKSVGNLTELLSTVISKVSSNLRILNYSGLVVYKRRGKYKFYSLRPDIFQSVGIINLGCCRLRLGRARR
jgi:DNA-binding transcriptional ArsR family regulator